MRIRFVYSDGIQVDPYYLIGRIDIPQPSEQIIRGRGESIHYGLAPGVYEVVAFWPDENGEEVGRRTLDLRNVSGYVVETVNLALRDVTFAIVDRHNRPVSGARGSISPALVRVEDMLFRPDGVITILRIPDGRTYDFTVEWTSPYGTTARAAVRDTPAGLQSRGSIVIPVDDVTLKVIDLDGRPVAGAVVTFGGQQVGITDSQGVIVVGQVPLDNEYQITVSKDDAHVGEDRVRFTASRISATIQASIYDIIVLVRDTVGQPLQGATVELQKGGTTVATTTTDAGGTAVLNKVIGADYVIKASYNHFSSSMLIPKGVKQTTIQLGYTHSKTTDAQITETSKTLIIVTTTETITYTAQQQIEVQNILSYASLGIGVVAIAVVLAAILKRSR